MKVVKDSADFNKFLSGEFKNSVLEFNGACGKSAESVVHVKDAVQMVMNEARRVFEELTETITATFDKDRTERLDGVVDVYWTSTQFTHLITTFNEKFGKSFGDEIVKFGKDEISLISAVGKMSQMAIEVGRGEIISDHAIQLAANRIIANNKQKYTDDVNKAKDWENHLGLGQMLKSYEYNGKTLYCIKRVSDDYVVKPYDFQPVRLGDLV